MRKSAIVLGLLLAIGAAASAEDKVTKETGTGRARFAWDKWDGNFASEQSSLARIIEGAGTGSVALDATSTAIWVDFDPDQTRPSTMLGKLKDAARYEAAKLTSVVTCFDSPGVSIQATATVKAGKGTKLHGHVAVFVTAKPGHQILLALEHKRAGRFQPGIVIKQPAELELEKNSGKADFKGSFQSYTQGFTTKKGWEDSTISVTVDLIDKTKDGKEALHQVELSVPVLAP